MGPELALALSAGGTAAQMIGARQQGKERRAILNREMDRTAQTQKQATQQVLDEAANFDPSKRAEAMQQAEEAAYQQAQADVGQGAAAAIPTASGAVSGDYAQAKAQRALDEGLRLSSIAREAAKVRAPGSMQRDEALRRAALAGDLGSRWSTTRNMNQAGQMDAESVEMPWYGELGKIASAVGSASMMAPGGGAPATGLDYGLAAVRGGEFGDMSRSVLNPGSFWRSPGARIKFGGA